MFYPELTSPMNRNPRKEITAYGVRVLLSHHPEVRRLKRLNTPTVHGHRHWSSSWLLVDYLHKNSIKRQARVMDVGCGWGLAGIYCAKRYGALVTGVDMDSEVFPFLDLHARINRVRLRTIKKTFGGLSAELIRGVDILIGADICFWDSMIPSLRNLISRALRAGVRTVLVADPGRPPFEQLASYFVRQKDAEILDWTARKPRNFRGRILKITG